MKKSVRKTRVTDMVPDDGLIDRILADMPEERKLFVDKSMQISERISEVLTEKGINHKQFAELLGKSEAEISKYMCGTHNFTLRTICLIETRLNHSIIHIPFKQTI